MKNPEELVTYGTLDKRKFENTEGTIKWTFQRIPKGQ
jgi:hypothetical protein